MGAVGSASLRKAVAALTSQEVPFVLVHKSALAGWGININTFLDTVDVIVLDQRGFTSLDCEEPGDIGTFAKCDLAGVPVRLWSRRALGLADPIDVTACPRYGCEALAPELVLRKMPYSPDAPLLHEQRALLAAIIMADELTDDEIMLAAHYVRGI